MIAKNRRGMSLVELLVVIVIISILSALVLPSFKNVLSERKTNVAALEVKSFLEAARARAIARGRNVSVIFERLSSRGDGFGINAVIPISSTNLARSISSENNVVNTSPIDINYTQYNTSVRMTMAETLRPTEYEVVATFFTEVQNVENGGTSTPPYYGDIDGIVENNRILLIPAPYDQRLLRDCTAGNRIVLLTNSGHSREFVILGSFVESMTNRLVIQLDNEGNPQQNFGSIVDVQRSAVQQRALRPFVEMLSGITGLRIYTAPIVLAAVTNELPRGTCIDLSLSGLASDDALANYLGTEFTNCQRQFASDWILSPTVSPRPPRPQELRPVYITFSPSGNIDSVMTNIPAMPTLQRIEPNQDIFLFVGRTDQVIMPYATDPLTSQLTLNARGIGDRRAEGAKPNLLDPTGYWIRISATNGSVAAAPTQAWHVENDVNEAAAGNPADALGEMLTESRALTFQSELSSE